MIHGLSGHTGELIAESLHNRGIAFMGAGRNAEKMPAAMEILAQRAGAGSLDAAITAVGDDEEALTAWFSEAKPVVKVTGAFMQKGEARGYTQNGARKALGTLLTREFCCRCPRVCMAHGTLSF